MYILYVCLSIHLCTLVFLPVCFQLLICLTFGVFFIFLRSQSHLSTSRPSFSLRLNCIQPLPLNQGVNTTLSDGGVLDILRSQPIYKVCIGNYRGPVSFTLHLPPDAIKPRRVESRREKRVFIKPTALHSWNGQHPLVSPPLSILSSPLPFFPALSEHGGSRSCEI